MYTANLYSLKFIVFIFNISIKKSNLPLNIKFEQYKYGRQLEVVIHLKINNFLLLSIYLNNSVI